MIEPISTKYELNFIDLIETLRKDDDGSENIAKIIVESIKETIEMAFGQNISKILENILEIGSMEREMPFDANKFMDSLNGVFGQDAFHLNIMTQGKILTKDHYIKLRKKIDGGINHSHVTNEKY